MIWFVMVLSLDSLGAGLSYGMRRIRFSAPVWGIVAGCTALMMSISMVGGAWLAHAMTSYWASRLGGLILVGIGCTHLFQAWRQKLQARPPNEPVARIHLRSLGVVVAILRDPALADRDHSGFIDPGEGLALGLSLGLDSLLAGVSAALLGYSWLLVPAVALGCVAFCWMGMHIGHSEVAGRLRGRTEYLPGILLILLGLKRL